VSGGLVTGGLVSRRACGRRACVLHSSTAPPKHPIPRPVYESSFWTSEEVYGTSHNRSLWNRLIAYSLSATFLSKIVFLTGGRELKLWRARSVSLRDSVHDATEADAAAAAAAQ